MSEQPNINIPADDPSIDAVPEEDAALPDTDDITTVEGQNKPIIDVMGQQAVGAITPGTGEGPTEITSGVDLGAGAYTPTDQTVQTNELLTGPTDLTATGAAATALASSTTFDPQLVPASKQEFGDFQVNVAMQLAKPLRQSPRNIALVIVQQLNDDHNFSNLCEAPQIAGPGFINLTLKPETLIS